MSRVILEDPETVWARHHIKVVQVVAVGGNHGVVAPWNHDDIVVFHGASLVQCPVIGVDALERKTLWRI
jgi:hypothetical protein